MKRIVMLALLVVGTAAFANAKPVAAKGVAAKEISMRKHRKAVKRAKTTQAPKPVATPAKK